MMNMRFYGDAAFLIFNSSTHDGARKLRYSSMANPALSLETKSRRFCLNYLDSRRLWWSSLHLWTALATTSPTEKLPFRLSDWVSSWTDCRLTVGRLRLIGFFSRTAKNRRRTRRKYHHTKFCM